jgi:hypothetical protein
MALLLKMIVSRTGNNKYKLIKKSVFTVAFFKNNNSISVIEYCACENHWNENFASILLKVLLMNLKELTHIPYLIPLFEVEMSTSLRLQFLSSVYHIIPHLKCEVNT